MLYKYIILFFLKQNKEKPQCTFKLSIVLKKSNLVQGRRRSILDQFRQYLTFVRC